MPVRMMSELFDQDPYQWGLRGDPYAWAAISRSLATVPVPQDAHEVESLLKRAFEAVVGVELDDPDAPAMVYVAEFAHGGMSSGHVSISAWRELFIPLLMSRTAQRK